VAKKGGVIQSNRQSTLQIQSHSHNETLLSKNNKTTTLPPSSARHQGQPYFQIFWNGSSSSAFFALPPPAPDPPKAPNPVSMIGAARGAAVPPQTSCEETKCDELELGWLLFG
jgi:hypothetical protein